jgi:hypothetical protein
VEDWPDRDVVDVSLIRGTHLLAVVRREAHQSAASNNPTGAFRAQIILANMYTVKVSSQAKVSTIIHDQPNLIRIKAANPPHLTCLTHNLAGIFMLIPELD